MTNSPSPSTDLRTRALIAALLASGFCPQILPSTSSNAAPLKTIADIDIVTDLSHYLPVVRGTRAGEMIGKLRLSTNAKLRDIKLSILSTLQEQKLYLDRTFITAGTRDVFLGWLHHSIPRFFDCDKARKELALLMNTPQEQFALSRKIVTINDQSAEVIAINGVKEHEEALITALSIAFESSQIRISHELASLTFIPKVIDSTTQLKFLSEHTEFLKTISYSYVTNLGDIDKPLGLDIEPNMTARDAILRVGINKDNSNTIIAINQSYTKLGSKIVYIVYPNHKPETHHNLAELFNELVKDANATALHHDINDGIEIRSPATHISTSPSKRLKPTNPHANPALLSYINNLKSSFPELTSTTTTSTTPNTNLQSYANHQSYANAVKSQLPKASSSLTTTTTTRTPPPPPPPKPITNKPDASASSTTEDFHQLKQMVASLQHAITMISAELTSLKTIIAQLPKTTTLNSITPSPLSSITPPKHTPPSNPTPLRPKPTLNTNFTPPRDPMDLDTTNSEDIRMSINKRTIDNISTPPKPNSTHNSHQPSLPVPNAEQREGTN